MSKDKGKDEVRIRDKTNHTWTTVQKREHIITKNSHYTK